MNNHLILYLLLIKLNSYIICLICEYRDIPNCSKCNEDLCVQCEDKYFPLYDGLICVKCDDEVYGNIGCEGKCDGSNYLATRNIICEKCKEGYYNLMGICYSCSRGSDYCSKCEYINNKFKCLECTNDKYRVSPQTGKCQPCSIANCEKCFYPDNSNEAKCEKCYPNYYINGYGTCDICYRRTYNGENCLYCPPDKRDCYCTNGYIYNDDSKICVTCPSYCSSCIYNSTTKSAECITCNSGYIIDSFKNCIYCGNCYSSLYCYLENNLPKCTKCGGGYISNEQKTCTNCPTNCYSCFYNNIGNLLCDSCYSNYVMNKENYCIPCNQDEEIGGKGCISCQYITNSKINICNKCNSNYIYITNERVCREPTKVMLSPYCINAQNLGTKENPKYSCTTCNSNVLSIYNKEGIMNCYPREGVLQYCQNGIFDEKDNLNCTKCLYNLPFIWSEQYNQTICDSKCLFGYFFKENWCYECDHSTKGNPGCIASKGCNYTASNDELDCAECNPGYYLLEKQCIKCSIGLEYCSECHFDNEFKCDKCKNNYFLNNSNKCELIRYDEYPEITPGCINTNKNITLYKSKNICLYCKPGFFKTKDESCFYCKARKNGGPKCDECEYKKKVNGIETEEIICKKCNNSNLMSSDGKCYNCQDEVGFGCLECGFENNNIICLVCKENYIKEDGHCISYQSYFKTIPFCSEFEFQ